MACINEDGTTTEAARTLLALLEAPMTPEEISSRLGRPLYIVRASLRELNDAGLLEPNEGDRWVTAAVTVAS
jgi:predicted transcriptional regulator